MLEEGAVQGAIKEAQKILVLLGRHRFGPPTEQVIAGIEGITDLDRLENMSERLPQVASWQELLGKSE